MRQSLLLRHVTPVDVLPVHDARAAVQRGQQPRRKKMHGGKCLLDYTGMRRLLSVAARVASRVRLRCSRLCASRLMTAEYSMLSMGLPAGVISRRTPTFHVAVRVGECSSRLP